MTPNPIRKVLSTLTLHQVQYLLMGGQACVLYGAAEFSKDTDIVVLTDPANLDRLSEALSELQATCIAVPPFTPDYLQRGHAVHFRCRHPEARDMRVDVMAVMRGVDPFDRLWERRTTLMIECGLTIHVLALPDLVQAKKTQRARDWPMIRRLVEAHYAERRDNPHPQEVVFWLHEARTVSILMELAQRFPGQLAAAATIRSLLSLAAAQDMAGLAAALEAEEKAEREADHDYWRPLREELEALRHARRKG